MSLVKYVVKNLQKTTNLTTSTITIMIEKDGI